ncbi:hypothetical protein [Herbaspirillum robiniae]|uniref:hypothetical protein n=1 Tax=Herbaspirillum robiniae TaxID=2014887 RepID=UPI00101AEAEB|nr:hypothetical protein [Herbaspirillum robiniae]
MKALKSQLAKEVLANPQGKAQLRHFLEDKSERLADNGRYSSIAIEITVPGGKSITVRPRVVAKAA